MLKENIAYKENLPVNCTIMNLDEYPIHFHNDLEIVYVLQGKVKLKNGYYNYSMEEGDVYILNDREIHSYNGSSGENAVLILQINLSYFSRYYEILRNSFFITDMNGVLDESLVELQELLARIALENLSCGKGYEERIISLVHSLINCLINNFQYFSMEDGKFVNESKTKGNKVLAGRLSRITEYMYENYSRRLTLTEIAEKEHLSIYYLSHFIKEATGLSFQELLSFIRVEESEKLLLGTDKKIGEISVESGFSAVRYYIKYFTKWFGMHPSIYRVKYTGQVKGADSPSKFTLLPRKEAEKLLRVLVEDIFDVTYSNPEEVIAVEFDTEEFIWKHGEGCEEFSNLMDACYMKPIRELLYEAGAGERDVALFGKGYFIMRNSDGKDGRGRSGYSILFYNLSDKLLRYKNGDLSESRVVDEIKKHDKSTEFFVKLLGVEGPFRIARCKYSKEAILYHCRKNDKESGLDSRETLIEGWLRAPFYGVDKVAAAKVLNIQAKQSGSSVEIVLIDPL
jgi:AraC-like DNA-binding protein